MLFVVSSLVVACAGPVFADTARPAASPAPAAGWRTVSYHGIRLRAPVSWPVVSLVRHPAACPRLDVHAVYLGAVGPDPSCPPGLHGKTEAVQIQPASPGSPGVRLATAPATIGGQRARTNPDSAVTHTITDVIPAAGAEVDLSYGHDRALAERIGASITVTPGSRATSPARAALLARPAPLAARAAQGTYAGPGFDTCAAPSASALASWLASPYRAIGIYIGGINRACAQSNLTAAWISAIQAKGWHYFPFYAGLQASCVLASGDALISSGSAAAQGRAAAADAAAQAQNLGIPAGTPLIYDMEAYGGCGHEVVRFLSAWDTGLHARGYEAGVYESFSNIGDLISAAGTMTEPDVIAYADWDGQATTTSPYMPSRRWLDHHRIHQYSGGHEETWGGTTLDIDNDQLDVSLAGPAAPAPARGHAGFRIAVGINANGAAEWFARSATGTLLHSYQHPLGSALWSQVGAVGRSPAGFAGNPAVAADSDGRLVLVARNSAGHIRVAWQQRHAPGGWQWGGPLRTASAPAAVTGGPAAVQLPGGAVAVLVTGADGAVSVARQVRPDANRSWTRWRPMGGSCASSPVAHLTARHRVAVFCITTSRTLAVMTGSVTAAGGLSWTAWAAAGHSPAGLTGLPAVAVDGTGQTEVFAAASGRLLHAWQGPAGGRWTWGPALTGATRATKVRNSPAATTWPGGRVAVVAQLADGRAGLTVQQGRTATASWSGLAPIGGTIDGSPASWLNPGGSAEVAALAGHAIVASAYSGSGWTPWDQVGGSF
ncbi:MAG: glycoside hydrolase domain-containing protein [Streptosporangiaceae bacterium]